MGRQELENNILYPYAGTGCSCGTYLHEAADF